MEVLKINSDDKEFPDGIPHTLTDLLEEIGIKQETVVAEIDGKIIDRKNFAKTQLASNQSIELVRFVGGG